MAKQADDEAVIRFLVSDLPPDVTEQYLDGYFDSRGAKGFKVVSPPSEGKSIIEIKDMPEIENFCAKPQHKIKSSLVRIQQIEDGRNEPEADPSIIEVLYPASDLDLEMLESYFSGPTSGIKGRNEKKVEWKMDTIEPGICHIKFESPTDAGDVLAKKNHLFMKKELTVRQCQLPQAHRKISHSSMTLPLCTTESSKEKEMSSGVHVHTMLTDESKPTSSQKGKSNPASPSVAAAPTLILTGIVTETLPMVMPTLKSSDNQLPTENNHQEVPPIFAASSVGWTDEQTASDHDSDSENTTAETSDYDTDKLIIRNVPQTVTEQFLGVFINGKIKLQKDKHFFIELKHPNALVTFAKEYSQEELSSFCTKISSRKINDVVLVAERCHANCTIKISNITSSSFASRDGLEIYFESESSGGGENVIEEVVMLGSNRAKVTFKSSKVAESVLSKDHSNMLGPDIKVVALSLTDTSDEETDIESIPNAMDEEKLLINHGSARAEVKVSPEIKQEAIPLSLCPPLVAETLKNNSTDGQLHESSHSEAKTSPYTLSSSSLDWKDELTATTECNNEIENNDYDTDKLIIKNVPQTVTEQFLGVFINGKTKLQKDKHFFIELKHPNALVTFAKEYSQEELNDFCTKISSRKIKDVTLVVEKCRTNCTVMLSNITNSSFASQDDLEMYFESESSGGGEDVIEEVVMLGSNRAKVTFKNSKVAESVISKDHTSLLGPNIKVIALSLLDTPEEEETDDTPIFDHHNAISAAEESHDWPKVKKQEALPLHDNEPLSSEAFKNSTAVEGQEDNDQTESYTSEDDEAKTSEYDTDKLIIKNVPQAITEHFLGVFLNARIKLENKKHFFIELKHPNALVTFAEEYSKKELSDFCTKISSRKIKDVMLVAERCRTNCTVLLSNITDSQFTSQDDLEMYFESESSGGGENVIEEVVMLGSNRAKVTFKSSKVAESVISKDHTTLGPNIKVKAFSLLDTPLEEETIIDHDDLTDETSITSPIDYDNMYIMSKHQMQKPQVIPISLNPLVTRSIKNNPELLDKIRKEAQMAIFFNDVDNGDIDLLPIDGLSTAVPPMDVETRVKLFHSIVSSAWCVVSLPIPQEAVKSVYPIVGDFSSKHNLQLDFKQEYINVVGPPHLVNEIKKEVEEYCEQIIQTIADIELSHEDFMYFSRCAMKQAETVNTAAAGGVEIELKEKECLVCVSGSRRAVTQFKDALPTLTKHVTVQVHLPSIAIEFLKQGKGHGILQTLIGNNNILPYFSTGYADKTLWLLCSSERVQVAEIASTQIASSITVESFTFSQFFFSDVVESPKFSNFTKKLSETYAFHYAVMQNKLQIVCRAVILSKISRLLEEFVTEECSLTEVIQLKKGVWRLFHSPGLDKKWDELKNDMKKQDVSIVSSSKPRSLNPYVKITGERDRVAMMKAKLLELQATVKEKEMSVSRPGIVKYFYKDPHGQTVLKGVESEARVCIELEVNRDKSDLSESVKPTLSCSFKKIYSANANAGVTISVYVGDITQFNRAEVIVNAANEDLRHGGGVANAIAKQGGPHIISDSEKYISKKGNVPTGSAVIFHRAGNLPPPYKAIVHAVGPVWRQQSDNERSKACALLRRAVKRSLKVSQDYRLPYQLLVVVCIDSHQMLLPIA